MEQLSVNFNVTYNVFKTPSSVNGENFDGGTASYSDVRLLTAKIGYLPSKLTNVSELSQNGFLDCVASFCE